MSRAAAHSLVALCLVVAVAVVAGRDDDRKPEAEDKLVNGYEVARLFTRDGVTVYRFYDRGEWRHFASSGSVSWTEHEQVYNPNTKTTRTVSYPRETQTVELDGGAK